MGDLKSRPEDRPCFPSRKAFPCYREISGEQGGAVVWFVMLPDGYLLDCGWKLGEARAAILSKLINDAGLEKIDREALEAFQ
jgi:hypothetical protein